jgi:hypothetical protein
MSRNASLRRLCLRLCLHAVGEQMDEPNCLESSGRNQRRIYSDDHPRRYIQNESVLLENGKVKAVGAEIPIPANNGNHRRYEKVCFTRSDQFLFAYGIYPLLGMQGNLHLSEAQGSIHSGIRSLDAVGTTRRLRVRSQVVSLRFNYWRAATTTLAVGRR